MEQVISLPGVRVVRIVASNAGPKTLEGTNTYLVLAHNSYIIDPGPDLPGHLDAISHAIAGAQPASVSILLTHSHPDHAEAAQGLAQRLNAPVLTGPPDPASPWPPIRPDRVLRGGEELVVDDQSSIRVVSTPGHTRDHLAFLLTPSGLLFSGDLVLGRGSTLIALPEGDVAAYLESLHLIAGLSAAMLAPGHGPLITRPASKIERDIAHRREREEAILDVVVTPRSVDEIVRIVYTDVPTSLHRMAHQSVQAQLAKLLLEGAIVEADGRYSRVST